MIKNAITSPELSPPVGPFSQLTGLLRGPMLGFSRSRVGLTNVPERQMCQGEGLARLPGLVA